MSRKQVLAAVFVVVVGLALISLFTIFKHKSNPPDEDACAEGPEIRMDCALITQNEKLMTLIASLTKKVETNCESPESADCCEQEMSTNEFSYVGHLVSFESYQMDSCVGSAHPGFSNENYHIWNLKDNSPLILDNELDMNKLTDHFWANIDPLDELNFPPGEDNGGCLDPDEAGEFTVALRDGTVAGGTVGPFFRFGKDNGGPYLQIMVHPEVQGARACALRHRMRFDAIAPFAKDPTRLRALLFK